MTTAQDPLAYVKVECDPFKLVQWGHKLYNTGEPSKLTDLKFSVSVALCNLGGKCNHNS